MAIQQGPDGPVVIKEGGSHPRSEPSEAKHWRCSECGVVARFDLGAACDSPAAVARPSQPAHWVADEEGWHCLRCQREAVANTPLIEGEGTRAQQRRRALVQFELLREPAATDIEIARRAKCPTVQVRPVRAGLLRSGSLKP